VNAIQSNAPGGSNAFVTKLSSSPVVSITATDPWASESAGDTGTFTVSRTGDLTNALAVSYIVGGDAVAGTDYAALSGSVVIPAGSSSAPSPSLRFKTVRRSLTKASTSG
jgi:hypothetical protein